MRRTVFILQGERRPTHIISGYIKTGALLNPDLVGIMSSDFVDHTDPLLSVSLSFITLLAVH